MDYYQFIATNFQATIETVASSVDTLALPMEQSSAMMTEALLAGGKIVTVGLGRDAAMATLLADSLLYSAEYERPALPALALTTASGLSDAARQLRALIGDTDVVVVFAISPCDPMSINSLLAAAKDGNARTVLVSNLDPGDDQTADPGTPVIALGELQQLRAIELATMVSCTLSSLIENNLFGNFNETHE